MKVEIAQHATNGRRGSLAAQLFVMNRMKELQTIEILPLENVSKDQIDALCEIFDFLTPRNELKRMLCDGSSTYMIEHLKPEYVEKYIEKIKDLNLPFRIKNTNE